MTAEAEAQKAQAEARIKVIEAEAKAAEIAKPQPLPDIGGGIADALGKIGKAAVAPSAEAAAEAGALEASLMATKLLDNLLRRVERGGSVHLHSPARLLSGASAGFMPLREAVC